jgi:sulfatase maturation enzyme AslB (radical SAM superfamily)
MQYQDDFEEVIKIIKKEIDKKKKKHDISIVVNGRKVALSEFPAEIIKSTLVGMLSSLKGVDQINEIEIRFINESEK